MRGLDFSGLNQRLLGDIRSLLSSWLPGGKLVGQEYCCGDLRGTKGDSLKVNIESGKWADFATGDKGGDLISLYAAINGIDQKQAYENLSGQAAHLPKPINTKPKKDHGQEQLKFAPPPKGTPMPEQLKNASMRWRYCSLEGETLFLTARYDNKDGSKFFSPWSWSPNKGWVKKLWPAPRPLYGLEYIGKNPDKPILIVEGEKAADAAREFAGRVYNVVTWSSGSKAFDKTNWKPIYGKSVLIWPDADEPGITAANDIAHMLSGACSEIKILDISSLELDKGADAADMNFNWKRFIEWAKPIAKIYEPPPPPEPETTILTSDEPPMPSEEDMPPTSGQMMQEYVEQVQEKLPHKYTPAQYALWQDLGLVLNASGSNPQYNVDNAMIVLERYKPLQNLCWYDEFHQKVMTYWLTENDSPREWADDDDIRLMRRFQSEVGMVRTTKQMVTDAIHLYAKDHRRNEPREWMSGLEWDGIHRIHNFFPNYMGAVESDYSQAVSKNFWISMAARIFKPGCKMDNMVILEGKQGAFKSTALNVIGGDWYTESNESMTSKDFYQVFQGNLIIEIGELDSFNKAETTTIKKVVSTQVDRFRPPYGKSPQDFPRQCIFVGTTNDKHYLRDVTGARRFWPIFVTDIKLGEIKRDREQLFAEAVACFKRGETWYEVPKSAELEQEKRRDYDVWEDIIEGFITGKEYITVDEICTNSNCIGMARERIDKRVQNRVARILRILGWENGGTKRILGKKHRVYEPTEPQQTKMPIPPQPEKRKVPNYAPGADQF